MSSSQLLKRDGFVFELPCNYDSDYCYDSATITTYKCYIDLSSKQTSQITDVAKFKNYIKLTLSELEQIISSICEEDDGIFEYDANDGNDLFDAWFNGFLCPRTKSARAL